MEILRDDVDNGQPGALPGTITTNGEQSSLHVEFDRETDLACLAVVKLVSVATGASPVALPPLQSVVDVDSLNRLVAPGSTDASETVCTSFQYEGFEVSVCSDGRVEAVPRQSA